MNILIYRYTGTLANADPSWTLELLRPWVVHGGRIKHIHTAPHAALGRHVKDEHARDAAQDVAKDVPQDVAQDLAFEARAARALLATPPPPPPPSLRSSR